MIRILSAAFVLLLLLGAGNLAPVLADEQVSINISTPSQVKHGSDFIATIDIAEVVNLNAIQYDIWFDSNVLQLYDITDGQIASVTISAMTNQVGEGHWRVVQSMGLDTVSGSGYLAILHFSTVGTIGTSSDIDITDVKLCDLEMNAIRASWGTGSVYVISAPPGEQSSMPEADESTSTSAQSTPSLPPPAPEPVNVPGTNAGEPSPALLYPPSPEPGKVAEVAPSATVAESEPAEMPPLPPAPQSWTVNWPLLWCLISGIFAIIILFFIFRPGRRRY